jgi:hypothetical protein
MTTEELYEYGRKYYEGIAQEHAIRRKMTDVFAASNKIALDTVKQGAKNTIVIGAFAVVMVLLLFFAVLSKKKKK